MRKETVSQLKTVVKTFEKHKKTASDCMIKGVPLVVLSIGEVEAIIAIIRKAVDE